MNTNHTVCSRHQRDPERGYCATCSRMKVERRIVLHTARALIKAGYFIMVNDGEDSVTAHTRDMEVITAALFSTDEDYFIATKADKPNGWVRFIYGNDGPEVINDYTVNLEPIMEKVNDFAERQPSHNG